MVQQFESIQGDGENEDELSAEERELRASCFRVMTACCANCLFGPNKLVSDERKDALLTEILAEDSFFVCHEASEQGQKICCRGFFERYKSIVPSLRLVQFYQGLFPGSLRFVEPTEDE